MHTTPLSRRSVLVAGAAAPVSKEGTTARATPRMAASGAGYTFVSADAMLNR